MRALFCKRIKDNNGNVKKWEFKPPFFYCFLLIIMFVITMAVIIHIALGDKPSAAIIAALGGAVITPVSALIIGLIKLHDSSKKV
jgi:membrane associated rhomboid family serine protease